MTSGGVLQLQNFQITDVIFRIITGLFCDIGVDCFAGPGRINTEFPKNLCHLIVSGALSVDQYMHNCKLRVCFSSRADCAASDCPACSNRVAA